MTAYLHDPDFTLYNGDAAEVLAELPAESVQMCVTSPPFFGLRDYGVKNQIGLEQTPEAWVEALVAVFEQVRRVLRKDGTLWVEVGDSYNNRFVARRSSHQGGLGFESDDLAKSWADLTQEGRTRLSFTHGGLKEKDLLGQPFLLAFALREAGWYWRNVLIWHKPNPMPESVRDRFTVAHSYVLLFSKSPRYFFDAEAVRERQVTEVMTKGYDRKQASGEPFVKTLGGHYDPPDGARNARSVWTIPTEPLPFEHYAAFPQALAERCIKAGTSERGCCPECGAAWVREVASELVKSPVHGAGSTVRGRGEGTDTNGWAGEAMPRLNRQTTTLGWRPPYCGHSYGMREDTSQPLQPIPCTVLDPFLGSGTTALVARRLGRRCIGIELNERYCELAAQRTKQLSLLAEEIA